MLRSYRTRLLIAFLGVVLSSLTLFMGLTLSQFNNYNRQVKMQELHLRLKLMSGWVDPLSPQVEDALHSTSMELGAALLLVYSDERPRFYAADGYVIPDTDAAQVKAILDSELPRLRRATLNSGDLVIIIQPVMTADQTPALLAAVIPSTNLLTGWRHLLDSMLYVALFGLAVSLLLALLLSRSIARPVTRLIAAADRMAQGVYDDPPLPASDDELGRLTRAFNTMRDQVRQSQQSQRDFLTGVSHDLKTPLAIVQGYVSALADGTADDEATRQRALAGIQREAERMARLITALLELARLEAGLVPFKPVALDLAALARQVLADFDSSHGARLKDELPSSLPVVQADPTQMERVLVNLLENALRFTPPDGVVTVGGSVERDNCVSIWVQDTGPGIPPEALPHVFDRFYQADPSRSTGRVGSGLGLTIAREIVTRHGGTIAAEGHLGHGARFTITLPIPRPEGF